MNPTRLIAAIMLSLLAALLAPLSAPRVRAGGKPLVVVVGASSSLRDVSTATLRRVFHGLPTELEPSRRAIPLNHPVGTPSRVQFDRAVLGLEPSQVGPFWIDRRIRDESAPPRTIPSPELALRVVASLPGAISYAYTAQLTAGVRALTIDGKSADQPGYLLR